MKKDSPRCSKRANAHTQKDLIKIWKSVYSPCFLSRSQCFLLHASTLHKQFFSKRCLIQSSVFRMAESSAADLIIVAVLFHLLVLLLLFFIFFFNFAQVFIPLLWHRVLLVRIINIGMQIENEKFQKTYRFLFFYRGVVHINDVALSCRVHIFLVPIMYLNAILYTSRWAER